MPSAAVRTRSTGWIPGLGSSTRSESELFERTGIVSVAPAAGSPSSATGTVTELCRMRPADSPSMMRRTWSRRVSLRPGTRDWWIVQVSSASPGTCGAGPNSTTKSPSAATHGLAVVISMTGAPDAVGAPGGPCAAS